MTDVNRILQVQMFGERRDIRGVGIHVVAVETFATSAHGPGDRAR